VVAENLLSAERLAVPAPSDSVTIESGQEFGRRRDYTATIARLNGPGEAAAVQVDDIDFLRRLHVSRRQVQRGPGGSLELRAPKHGSERTVTLPDRLLELLAAHIEPPVELIEATVRINPKKNSLTPRTSNGNPATSARGIAANASGKRQPASTFVRTSPTALRIRIAINDPAIPPVDPTHTTRA
jgi:integrase